MKNSENLFTLYMTEYGDYYYCSCGMPEDF